RPMSPHGVSYVANEFAANFYAENYGLDVLGMRLGLVFGHGRNRSGSWTYSSTSSRAPPPEGLSGCPTATACGCCST
ncbi:MAG: hypothetical protein ACP5GG_03260, partial [Conexivisphaera sp.]